MRFRSIGRDGIKCVGFENADKVQRNGGTRQRRAREILVCHTLKNAADAWAETQVTNWDATWLWCVVIRHKIEQGLVVEILP